MSYFNDIVSKILPKRNNAIVLYGRQKFDYNHTVLANYLISHNYNKRYKIYLVCTDKNATTPFKNIKNVKIVESKIGGYLTTMTAKYVFAAFGCGRTAHKKKKNQIVFNMWHGTALKTLFNNDNNYDRIFNYTLCAGKFAEDYFVKLWNLDESTIYRGGYPRCDDLFSKKDCITQFGIDKKQYKKVIVYMPTFRKSILIDRTDSQIDFPLITDNNIGLLNSFLKENNILFIIKPHQMQNDLALFQKKASNIMIIKNDDLMEKNISVYQLLSQSDSLITDYSSIYFDYLLVDKPIGFVVEDIGDYSDQRGFVVDNPLDYMPGEKIKDYNDLLTFISGLADNKDDWKEKRAEIRDITNYDITGNYCKKLLDFVGIKGDSK